LERSAGEALLSQLRRSHGPAWVVFAFVLTFAPSALAWDVVAIPNQALNAGNTGSVAVSTTGLFGSPLISWSVKRGVSLAGLCSYTNTAAPPPGMTITPGEDRREAT